MNIKRALVHDWYYVNGGAEKVIHSFNTIWDDFDHFALIDFLPQKDRAFVFNGKSDKVETSFIQKLPTAKSNHRKFLQLFPLAVEQFDLSEYDVIISSSASIAKGVLTHSNQIHISYVHSPMRYAWDLYHQYLKESGLEKGLKGWYAKYVLSKIRSWDVISTNRVDFIVANSKYIAKRIKKVYGRESHVIYPPVDINTFDLFENKEDFFLTASRMVPYKKIKLIVETFTQLPDRTLLVIGDGPEMKEISEIATPNIKILGHVNFEVLKEKMQKAKAFVFAAEEDFGIVPVEAQACGTPVIAFGKGGALETIEEGKSGIFFENQSVNSIMKALKRFEQMEFNPVEVRNNALKFSKERFEKEFKEYAENCVNDFYQK